MKRSDVGMALAGPVLAFAVAAAAEAMEIDAGPDRVVSLSEAAGLAGNVTGAQPPFASIGWSKAEGPGEVVFAQPHSAVTTATFSAPGEYMLMLGGFDGYVAYDMVRVTVLP